MEPSTWINHNTGIPLGQCIATISLLEGGATVPFIARYRKEKTKGLDEVSILTIKESLQKWGELVKRKESILSSIAEQGKLQAPLREKISSCWILSQLEDLYLPYKKKKVSRADKAKKLGLEPLSKIIMAQRTTNINHAAKAYAAKAGGIDEALAGARDIVAEWISENIQTRDIIRSQYRKYAILHAKGKKKNINANPSASQKYTDYFDHAELLRRCPSHRFLAIKRGEAEGYLSTRLQIDDERMLVNMYKYYIRSKGEAALQLEQAINDAYKRLVTPSIENEILKEAKQKADVEAIQVFQENLRSLLLEAPLGEKPILAIDPGFRSGCKVVALDQHGQLLDHATIYPHPPQNATIEAQEKITAFIYKYQLSAIAVGNGTAGRETVVFLKSCLKDGQLEIYSVNESGASIYSASDLARKEFGHLDLTLRGSISIGRRLMDPLAELIKIDPKSIGVGQYQHDVDQKLLNDKLDNVVSSCVNHVGINLNTASAPLLSYVAGIGPTTAERIITYRSQNGEFSSRTDLQKVKGLGSKTFEQAAGFLRIKRGSNPLDNSAVHPERYALVHKMAKDQNVRLKDLLGNAKLVDSIPLDRYVSESIGKPTLIDIFSELKKPGVDPRGAAALFAFADHVITIDDVVVGDLLPGIINNVTKFGAFVDIGIKESGLIHISHLSDTFVSDPSTIVQVNQKVHVKVLSVDKERKRIGLSMKV